MEPQSQLPQQEAPPVQKKRNSKGLILTIISIVLTTLLVGGGVYFWQQSVYNKEISRLSTGAEELRSENEILKTENETLKTETEELKNDLSSSAEKEEIEKKACKGLWVDGECSLSSCIDSDVNDKPDDIYIKGNVTFTDENGVATQVDDECTGSKTQVNEMWCYESPAGSGNYVQGKMIYDCPNGCLDGACIK